MSLLFAACNTLPVKIKTEIKRKLYKEEHLYISRKPSVLIWKP